MRSLRILLADDSRTFMQIARQFVERNPRLTVIDEAFSGAETVSKTNALRPDILIVDLAMPSMSGLDVVQILRAQLPDLGIIVLTNQDPTYYRPAAMAAGADAYVCKSELITHLLAAIWTVAQARGNAWGPGP